MKIKDAEQYVFPSDRWWKHSIFILHYWFYVLTIWAIGNLVQRIYPRRLDKP